MPSVAARKAYYRRHREKILARNKTPERRAKRAAWKSSNRARVRWLNWKRDIGRYGLTTEEWQAMMLAQAGECTICSTQCEVDGLCIDHDHMTGEVRGLLCPDCNLAIGKAKDDPIRLRLMATYLEDRRCAHACP